MIKRFSKFLVVAIAVAGLSSCTSIQLVSYHDEETERLATELQQELSTFFVNYQTLQIDAERSFSSNQDFYKDVAVKVGALKVRSNSINLNELTHEQVLLLERNLAWMALLHKNCIDRALTSEQTSKVAQKGVDVSANCRTDYGASKDLTNQGDNRLNPVFIPVLRNQFDQTLGAIIRLELAKRRGDTEE